jgi:hypothetical protein
VRPSPAPSRSTSIFTGRPLQPRERVALAFLIGVGAAVGAFIVFASQPEFLAKDFTYPWRAARALLGGDDPYRVIRPGGPYPFESVFPYPLPAAIVTIPFALLRVEVGGALFFGLSAGAMAYALSRDGMGRFWVFCSAPFGMALALGQWSPLMVAAALLSPLSWALACKPTLGAALFAYRPSRRTAVLGAVLVAASLVVMPRWPAEWLGAVFEGPHHRAPIARPLGVLALAAFIRWRSPEGRLVGLMACVPQNLYFYDQLPLWLAARSGRASFALTVASWLAYAGTRLNCRSELFCGREAEPWVLGLIYLPATLLVLADGDWRVLARRLRRVVGAPSDSAAPAARVPGGD